MAPSLMMTGTKILEKCAIDRSIDTFPPLINLSVHFRRAVTLPKGTLWVLELIAVCKARTLVPARFRSSLHVPPLFLFSLQKS